VFERLVANASPLIFLSRIEGLSWLPELGTGTVEVPRAAVREIEAGADGREVMGAVGLDARFVFVEDATPSAVIAAWDLGAGESQVLERCRVDPWRYCAAG
jgi:hypothetical protein